MEKLQFEARKLNNIIEYIMSGKDFKALVMKYLERSSDFKDFKALVMKYIERSDRL